MVKKDFLIGAMNEAFAQSWRTPIAQWIGQKWFLKKKPQSLLIKKSPITQSLFHRWSHRIDSQFSYFRLRCTL